MHRTESLEHKAGDEKEKNGRARYDSRSNGRDSDLLLDREAPAPSVGLLPDSIRLQGRHINAIFGSEIILFFKPAFRAVKFAVDDIKVFEFNYGRQGDFPNCFTS